MIQTKIIPNEKSNNNTAADSSAEDDSDDEEEQKETHDEVSISNILHTTFKSSNKIRFIAQFKRFFRLDILQKPFIHHVYALNSMMLLSQTMDLYF